MWGIMGGLTYVCWPVSAGRGHKSCSFFYGAMTGEFDWSFTLLVAENVKTNYTRSIVMIVDD